MKLLNIICISVVTLILSGCISPYSSVKRSPGYADMKFPSFLKTDTRMRLNLGPMSMKPLRWAMANSEEGDLEIIDDVEAIRLRLYDANKGRDYLLKAIDNSRAQLLEDGWNTIVSITDTEDRVVVMTAEEDGIIQGVSIMLISDSEAVFANLVGDLEPEKVAKLISKMHEKNS